MANTYATFQELMDDNQNDIAKLEEYKTIFVKRIGKIDMLSAEINFKALNIPANYTTYLSAPVKSTIVGLIQSGFISKKKEFTEYVRLINRQIKYLKDSK